MIVSNTTRACVFSGVFVGVCVAHWALITSVRWPYRFSVDATVALDPIEVSTWDRPVVFTHRSLTDNRSRARFLAQFRNRTDQETRSHWTGRFGAPGTGELALFGSGLMRLGGSPDVIADGVPRANETILNTDRYVYASFINRIVDSIYQPWVDEVQSARERLEASGQALESDLYVTRVAALIDAQGNVVGVQIVKSCGVEQLDDAPRRAFWKVAAFPHPPPAFFLEVETVRFQYEFHITLNKHLFEILAWTV